MSDIPLFLWRDKEYWSQEPPSIYTIWSETDGSEIKDRCQYCDTGLMRSHFQGPHIEGHNTKCRLCGWEISEGYYEDEDLSQDVIVERVIKTFSLNSSDVSLRELGAYIQKNYNNIYQLSPRKFEMLVEDVFKNHGFKTQLTKSTKDGGFDIILFNNNAEQAIVEVKRYRNNVGVELVRQLRGVQLYRGINKATLVTAGHFTKGAITEATAERPRSLGFELNLIDAEELLKMLSVYNSEASSLIDIDILRGRISCDL